MVPAVLFIIAFCVGLLIGLLINSRRINKTIKEAREQIEIGKRVIEQNKKLI